MFNHIPIKTPEIETAHYDGKHFYSINGEKYPSITTILHSFPNKSIESWKAKTPNWEEIQKESFEVGTNLHSIIELYLKNVLDVNSIPDRFDKCPDSPVCTGELFYNLQDELYSINNIRCQETRLYHKDLKVAGTVDCIAEYDGELSIIDFKNSRKPKREKWINDYKLQVAAYSKMFEYCTGEIIETGIILIANWDGRTWENYISKASGEEKEQLKKQIILLDNKLSKYL